MTRGAAHRNDIAQPVRAAAITAREADCLAWAAAGRTAWEIATILGIAEFTVAQHLAKARRKLGAANTTHACIIYDRQVRR